MKFEVSVILPTIRVHLLDDWYASLEKAIPDHSFEVVCCGPFRPSEDLMSRENFIWIKSYASPTVCAQECALVASGKYLLHSVDDALYFQGVVSQELRRVDLHDNDIVAMRYREGENYSGETLPDDYWYCKTAYRGWSSIDPEWIHCVHFMMRREKFMEVGGFDCKYHYLNHATHDMLYRSYMNGCVGKLSNSEITTCSWQPQTTGDHAPIHNAQIGHDQPLFVQRWGRGRPPIKIQVSNWVRQPEVWRDRFTGEEEKYADLG